MPEHVATGTLTRVSVSELLGYPSMDADAHQPSSNCPRTAVGRCVCAGSVVRGILAANTVRWCPSHRGHACRLQQLLEEYDRDGDFARPLHVPSHTVSNGHHRLAVASLRGARDLLVDTHPREPYAMDETEARWQQDEITQLVRNLPYWYSLSECAQEVQDELGFTLEPGSAGRRLTLEIIRTARP